MSSILDTTDTSFIVPWKGGCGGDPMGGHIFTQPWADCLSVKLYISIIMCLFIIIKYNCDVDNIWDLNIRYSCEILKSLLTLISVKSYLYKIYFHIYLFILIYHCNAVYCSKLALIKSLNQSNKLIRAGYLSNHTKY